MAAENPITVEQQIGEPNLLQERDMLDKFKKGPYKVLLSLTPQPHGERGDFSDRSLTRQSLMILFGMPQLEDTMKAMEAAQPSDERHSVLDTYFSSDVPTLKIGWKGNIHQSSRYDGLDRLLTVSLSKIGQFTVGERESINVSYFRSKRYSDSSENITYDIVHLREGDNLSNERIALDFFEGGYNIKVAYKNGGIADTLKGAFIDSNDGKILSAKVNNSTVFTR